MRKLESLRSNVEYRLIREISRGGMGCVYEAEQIGAKGFSKRVAIKTIKDIHLDNPEFITRFIDEARLVANLVHPNIVQIYHLDKYPGGYYFAMEYINGITCSQFLQLHTDLKVPTPIDYITFIISRIARGLEYAHDVKGINGKHLDIVHRDVCPKNIMITSEGEGKLTDFGIAKSKNYTGDNEGEILLGKVRYMSPEQAMLDITDSRSDIFSLGIVYYEMLTGVSPFMADSSIQSLSKVRMCSYEPAENHRKDIPEEVLQILSQMLAKDPSQRYNNAGDLSTDLETSMYSKGYGPTIKKLSKYLFTVFPEFDLTPKSPSQGSTNSINDRHNDLTTKKFPKDTEASPF